MTIWAQPSTWEFPLESREWVGPFTVTKTVQSTGQIIISTDWKIAVLPSGSRPTIDPPEGLWQTPLTLDDGMGVMVGPGTTYVLARGTYRVWIQVPDINEEPVLNDVGTIVIV